MPYACIWRAPFTSIQLLQTLAPGGAPTLYTYPQAITSDGSTLYGRARHPDGRYRAVKWNTTTLAITMLEEVSTTGDQSAAACSASGSIVIGGTSAGDYAIGPVALWTGGGTSGAPLPSRNPASTVEQQWPNANTPYQRTISDDGTAIACFERPPAFTAFSDATFWLNGVQHTLPGVGWQNTHDWATAGISVSANGQVIVGAGGYDNPNTGPQYDSDAAYWTGLTTTPIRHLLVHPTESTVAGYGGAVMCNGDGSAIWGPVANATTIYFAHCIYTNVATPTGDGVHYGTYQMLPELPNTQGTNHRTVINCAAADAGSTIVVGYSSYGASDFHACKWSGAIVTDLGTLSGTVAGSSQSQAEGCNHDGSLVCGYSLDADFNQWAVKWDASNTIHALPSLSDAFDWFKGDAWGFSRDSSVIFGLTNVGDFTPPDVTTLTDAELVFNPRPAFVDLAVEANRRLFVAAGGTPQWMGAHGAIPFGGDIPQVYLTTLGPPADFTQNNGAGGGFPVSGSIDPADGPGCTDYFIPLAAGPASRPEWRLTVSDDGSRTWSRLVKPREIGVTGAYKTRLRWLKMGQFRQRVIKLECTDPIRRNIIGIYMDNEQGSV